MSAPVGEGMMNVVAESGKRFGAEKGAGGSGAEEGGMTDLYKVNQIWYRMLPSLSLVSKRTLLVNQAQKSQYVGTGTNVIFNFNTGEYYISPTTSYLYIQCGYNDPAAFGPSKALISQGNIMSLFREVAFTTASGTEVDRQQDKNLHSATFYRWSYPQDYIDTLGQVQGAATGSYSRLYDGVAPVQYKQLSSNLTSLLSLNPLLGVEGLVLPRSGAVSKSQFGYGATNLNIYSSTVDSTTGAGVTDNIALQLPEFCVPLDQVLGVFKPYLNTLMPAGALSGGRLELTFANMVEALQFIAGANAGVLPDDGKADVGNTQLAALISQANTAFQVANIYLVLDAFQLQDNVLKRLNQVSAGQDGLTYLYDTYDSTKTQQTSTGSIEVQVQQARSRIVRSVCIVRNEFNITNPYINSYASEAAVTRVCGKVIPGATTVTSYVPTPLNENNRPAGGGVTEVGLISTTTTAAAATVQQLMGTGTITYPLTIQPRLVDDPYKNVVPYEQETVSSYQAQLGALFFPQQPMTTAAEHYQNAQYVMCKGIPDREINSSVSFEDFKGGLGAGLIGLGLNNEGKNGNNTALGTAVDPTGITAVWRWVAPYGCAIYGFLAEKSQLLNLSGLPISNARLLRHRFTFARPPAFGTSRAIHCFTQFTRVMKTFLGGRVVVRE